MAWSTRQLADLAGTTLKAVRHHHDIGLLDEPERSSNGYKQYQVAHLVRLLLIKRLSDLSVPLSQIDTIKRADQDPDAAVRVLDAELKATIERLQLIRSELEVILHHRGLSMCGQGSVPSPTACRNPIGVLIMIYSRLFSEDATKDVYDMLRHRDPIDDEFVALSPDADVETIQSLLDRYVPILRRHDADYGWKTRPDAYARHGQAVNRRA